MQNLYAFHQNKNSDYYMALDRINEDFELDWSAEPEEKEILKQEKSVALNIFKEGYENGQLKSDQPVSDKIRESVSFAFGFYQDQIKKDFDYFRSSMVKGAERTYDLYLWILELLIQISEFVNIEISEKERKSNALNKPYVRASADLNLYRNRIIRMLKDDLYLQEAIKSRKVSWQKHKDKVWSWYKEIIKKSEAYQEYLKIAEPAFEDDRKAVGQIIKSVIFKNEVIDSFMEEEDLFWQEDKDVIKSMLIKTIKNMNEETGTLELMTLSNNWEDDKEYFKLLFEFSVRNQKEYEKILAEKIKNWEIDRIATLDYILLQMAMNEMINFPSIPVKVTINEYIEISKLYSTPKSKHFINGVLDVIANQLTDEGMIRKSGRGLIDNK